jgi:tripartite-type tricarboxylate transporter receptor subunit TctC
MRRRRWVAGLLVAGFGLCGSDGYVGGAAAQTPEAFYKGRTVEMIVGSDAATEYTRDARLLITHMVKYIPGKPTIILKNMPGASGIKSANYLHRIAAQDGSVLGSFNKAMPLYEASKLQGVEFKSVELGWIGSMSHTNSLLVTWRTSPVKTVEDAKRREATIGAVGLSGTMAGYPFLMNAALGTKFKVIAGYTGSAAVNLAMERGEVEGRGTYSWDFFKSDNADWKTNPKMNFLVQIGLEKESDLPDVPLLIDLAQNDKERAVFELISIDSMIARPFVTTPNVPKERLVVLRAAFDRTMTDSEFLKDAEKMQSTIAPISGDRVEALVRRIIDTPPAVIETANLWLSPPR